MARPFIKIEQLTGVKGRMDAKLRTASSDTKSIIFDSDEILSAREVEVRGAKGHVTAIFMGNGDIIFANHSVDEIWAMLQDLVEKSLAANGGFERPRSFEYPGQDGQSEEEPEPEEQDPEEPEED